MAGVGTIAILAYGGSQLLGSDRPEVDDASVTVGRVERELLRVRVKGTGKLVPVKVRWVTAETSGSVERIFVEAGDLVSKGDTILQLNNSDLELQAALAERDEALARTELEKLRHRLAVETLEHEATVAELDAARRDAERRATAIRAHPRLTGALDRQHTAEKATALRTKDELAAEQLEEIEEGARRMLRTQGSQVAKATRVSRLRDSQLKGLTVRAAEEGTVQDLLVEPGQWVTPGSVLAKLIVSDELRAQVRVSEARVQDVSPGQEAVVDTRAGVISARVEHVATAAAEGTVQVDLTLTGDLPDVARPDLSVDAHITVAKLDDVLTLPRPVGIRSNSRASLFRLEDETGMATRVDVAIGMASLDAVEVRSGLKEGDEVVLSDMSRWSDKGSIVLD